MSGVQAVLDQQRLDDAKQIISAHGSQFSAGVQKAILEQKVIAGMTPYEAQVAAGAYFFKVEADKAVWPIYADPNLVIAKQATQPDNSKIWLTFETATQFPEDGRSRFTVYFEKGRALTIEKISRG